MRIKAIGTLTILTPLTPTALEVSTMEKGQATADSVAEETGETRISITFIVEHVCL
jgi:hypothetical protein